MNFATIFQLRGKKIWWMDVVFYFVISLLIAAVFCWLIFLVKNNYQREDIRKEILALQTVGTEQQKIQEKGVIDYRNKINSFISLLKNHEFASNAFAFLQTQTMPNVWFKQFNLDKKNNGVQLSGEADDLGALSAQVAVFEKNKYVKDISTFNSALGQSARVGFNLNLVMNQDIFSYLSDFTPVAEPEVPPVELPNDQGQTPQDSQLSDVKAITSFRFLITPEVSGVIEETNHTITLSVPYGTDINRLAPSIVTLAGAVVSPVSDIPQDFASPVIYTVTAEDGSTQNYAVKVVVEAKPADGQKSTQSVFSIILKVILLVLILAAIFVGGLYLYKKKFKNRT